MKDIILAILNKELTNAYDNLNRAKRICSNMSDYDLDNRYGESNMTYKEMKDGYQKQVDTLLECMAWVNSK